MEAEDVHMAEENSETKTKLKKKLGEPTILEAYTKLISDKEKIRLNAGVKILKYLLLDANKTEQEHNYALDRLVRGVGSSKINSRTGFYTVLHSFLTYSSSITVNDVLQAIDKHLATGGSNSKSENADISAGQIFTVGALIHSGKFLEEANAEEQTKIINILITAGNKRSYLLPASYIYLIEVIEKCGENMFKDVVWPAIKPELSKPWSEQNLNSIRFLDIARSLYPSVVKQKFLNKTLNSPEIVHEDSVKPLCHLLLNISMLSEINNQIYEYIGKKIAESDIIPMFCAEIEQQLMKPTRNKHLVTTHLFTIILKNMTDFTQIPNMLTNQFIIITLNTFKNTRTKDKKDDFVIKMYKFFETLEETLKKEEVTTKTKIAILKKLLFFPGSFIFEKITKSKLIQHITMTLNSEGVQKLCKLYKEVIIASKPRVINENKTETWINMDRTYAANLVVKLIGHQSVQQDNDWKLEQAKFLLKLGLFKTDSDSNVGIELAASLKECFYHVLDLKFPKLEDLRNFLSSIIHFIDEEIFIGDKTDHLRTPLSEEGVEIWKNMITLVKNLETKKKFKQNYAAPVFHTLLLHMGLQLLSDFNLAESALKELQSCFKRLESKTENDNEPIWIEVAVDLFLSLLSQNSHLLRSVIGCVFPYLCPHLTIQAMHQILEVLDPKNDENPLSKNKTDDDDDDSDSADEEKESNNEDESEESDISDLEEEEIENETTTDKLRSALRDVLHKNGYQTDDESVDMDQMDEEEGNKLDEALAEAFGSVKKSKGKSNKQNKDDKTLTHFRVRVLDLIEMYIDSEPSMLFCLEIAVMLLQILEFSIRDVHQKPLENRVRGCLKKLTTLKKFSTTEGVTEQILVDMLNSFIDKGSKSAFIYQDMGEKISECVIFIIRCSQLLTKEEVTPKKLKKKMLNSPIVEILSNSLKTFFVKRDSLLPIVLFKLILQTTWYGNWALVPILMEYPFNNDTRPFRRSQALELLKLFYNNNRLRLLDTELFKKNVRPLEMKLSENTIDLLKLLSENPQECKVKEKFVCHLFNLLFAIKNIDKQNENVDWSTIGNLIREYRSHVSLSKDAKSAYNRLCSAIGVPNLVKMQIIANGNHEIKEDSESETNSQDDKKIDKKRKKNKSHKKDKAKLKKEANLLRMQASSEGLEPIEFSNVLLSDKTVEVTSETENNSDEDTEKTSRKRHNSQSEKTPKKKKKRNND